MVDLPVLRLDGEITLESPRLEGDAGIDLVARIGVTLSTLTGPVKVPTGVAVAIPAGHVGLICSRSGLAAAHGIAVLNAPGVVDSGYRGELEVVLFATRAQAKTLRRGDRIAQLLVVPIATPRVIHVDTLDPTRRGTQGFGSTGP